MASRYTFTEYSPEWPRQFAREAARLKELLGGALVTVHHIGSTSVPGLAAKSVIDLLPEVSSLDRIDELTPTLETAGYKAWGEYGIPGRRYFTKDRGGYRTHNVHMFQVGGEQIERHLAFRAYLRSHEDARADYEALKREIFARHSTDTDMSAYNDEKDAWIKRTERLAIAWYRQQKE